MAIEKTESKSGNSGLDVYLATSVQRIAEKTNKTGSCGLAAAGAALIPFGLGSTKVVVMGRENFLTSCVYPLFNLVKHLFGGF